MTYRFWTATTLCLALLFAIPACDQSASQEETTSEESAGDESASDESAEETGDDSQDESADEGDSEQVEVAVEGTDFNPPIQPQQLPEGVYYCDMGTVHWAGGEEPEEGQCPRCGMDVKQYDPDERAEQQEAAGDHAHDGEGDHDHPHGEGEHHEH